MPVDEETLKRRYREFLDLMPATITIAGLPPSNGPYNFTPDQMEVRAQALTAAFRMAKQIAREAVSGG